MSCVVEVRVCHGAVVEASAAPHPEAEDLFVYTVNLYPSTGSKKEEKELVVEEGRDCEHDGKRTVVSSVAPHEVPAFVLVLAGYTLRKEKATTVAATKVAGIWSHGEFVEPEHAPHPTEPQFLKWPKTKHLNDVEQTCRRLPRGPINITYRAKVKLHGTNLAVQVMPDGRVFTQSRNRLLDGGRDHYDFDAWVQRTAASWRALSPAAAAGSVGDGDGREPGNESKGTPSEATVVFGEWCGKGIHKGDAICSLQRRVYCVFAVVLLNAHLEQEGADGVDSGDEKLQEEAEPKRRGPGRAWTCRVDYHSAPRLLVDPEEIKKHLGPMLQRNLDVYVIPWHGEPFTLTLGGMDKLAEAEAEPQRGGQAEEEGAAEQEAGTEGREVEGGGSEHADPNAEALARINAAVEDIAQRDPWVHEAFDVEGPGEGVVASPLAVNGEPMRLLHAIAGFMFKAKGERHCVKMQEKPAQLKTEVAASVAEFVNNTAVTPARCRQGEAEVGGRDRTNTSAFLRWIANDVQQECALELEAAGLMWKDVKRAVSTTARHWWFS